MTTVAFVSPENESAYAALLTRCPRALLYASLEYRSFLKKVLPNARDRYLLAMDGGVAVGAIPCFSLCHPSYGVVLNSLPYYGSNGGVMLRPDCDRENVAKVLLGAFLELANDLRAVSSTLIANPLDQLPELYEAALCCTHIDWRIGQTKTLPGWLGRERTTETLMESFHPKTRRMIRKARRGGFSVRRSTETKDFDALHSLHVVNMRRIGARAKSRGQFTAIEEHLVPAGMARLYVSDYVDEVAAALLVLYCNRTVEYFTPVINNKYRSGQPLSLLVFEAMVDAVKEGFTWWNWGGTHSDQTGVHRFKKHWGTDDRRYMYYIKVSSERLAAIQSDVLMTAFPEFYVYPYTSTAQCVDDGSTPL